MRIEEENTTNLHNEIQGELRSYIKDPKNVLPVQTANYISAINLLVNSQRGWTKASVNELKKDHFIIKQSEKEAAGAWPLDQHQT